ncbi:MAG: UvrB/UvrC motif-containing protein [Phycisphaeraceae bacterium]
MKRKCDQCDRPATHHSVEILQGKKIEKHLCDLHAAEEGLAVKTVQAPINELLSNFVKLHSSGGSTQPTRAELVCDECGLSFSDFREKSLMGCPNCYAAFENPLGPLLERAHEGGTHHIGKVPRRAGECEQRQMQLMHMRKRLDEAVANEDYELAARLRDDIQRFEENRT